MSTLAAVSDYMDTASPNLSPDMEIHDAVAFLLEKRVTGAPVVDESGCLLGLLTENECLRLLAAGTPSGRASGTVADFMQTDVLTIPPTMNIYFAAGMFLTHHFRRFPVVQDGRLVGAITRFDILRAIKRNE